MFGPVSSMYFGSALRASRMSDNSLVRSVTAAAYSLDKGNSILVKWPANWLWLNSSYWIVFCEASALLYTSQYRIKASGFLSNLLGLNLIIRLNCERNSDYLAWHYISTLELQK